MEIEDKAKAYDEMVQRVKELHEAGNDLTKKQMEIICPALAESEDERIRKELVAFFKEMRDTWREIYWHDLEVDGIIAYLEKQKESLHIPESCKENADSFTEASKDVIVAIEKYLDWLTGYPDYAPKGKYSIQEMLHCLYVIEKQKENPKSSDSIPSDCVSDAKFENRWHEVADSLPDNGREVLAKDKFGNTLLARYDGEGWDVSVYDDEDYRCHNGISKWREIPSEKQNEQKPDELDGKALLHVSNKSYDIGFRDGVESVKPAEWSAEHIKK
jgi:hypothetical protein